MNSAKALKTGNPITLQTFQRSFFLGRLLRSRRSPSLLSPNWENETLEETGDSVAIAKAMSFNVHRFDPQSAAEKAVSVLGFGYDLCNDIRLSSCKPGPSGSKLIHLDPTRTKDLVLPPGIVVPNVSTSIKCDKGERTRFRSDVISFNQVIVFKNF